MSASAASSSSDADSDDAPRKRRPLKASNWPVSTSLPSAVPIYERVCATLGLTFQKGEQGVVSCMHTQEILFRLLKERTAHKRWFGKIVGGARICTKIGLALQLNRIKALVPSEVRWHVIASTAMCSRIRALIEWRRTI